MDSLDGGQRPRRVRLLFLVAALVFVTDLVSKTIVVATLSHRPPIRLLGGLLRLTELRNPGAAFSIGASSAVLTVVFSLIAVGVIIAILRTSRRLRSVPWAVTLGLLLGGAAGQPGGPDLPLARPVPRLRGGLDPAAALAGVQRGRLVHRLRRGAGRAAGRARRPAGGHTARWQASPPDSDAPAGAAAGRHAGARPAGQHPAGDGSR